MSPEVLQTKLLEKSDGKTSFLIVLSCTQGFREGGTGVIIAWGATELWNVVVQALKEPDGEDEDDAQ